MKILYVAGREASYSRTRIILQALKGQGHEVVQCLPPDKSFRHYPLLLLKTLFFAPRCDAVLVGFYGQLLMPVIRLLTWKPIVFDMYISTYDTMVYDRAVARPGSWKAKIYGFSDWLSYQAASMAIFDSQFMIDHFKTVFKVDGRKFRRIFLAVDDAVLKPMPRTENMDRFTVHFHGEYIPFHGVEYILKAAKLLEKEDIHFQIVGRGATYLENMALAKSLQLEKVRFIDPVPYASLAKLMANADVCLGVFGNNERAELVLTNKVIEAIAMGKPLLTRRNAPVQELLEHGKSVYLVNPADETSLAQGILALFHDSSLRHAIAQAGHERFHEQCTVSRLGAGLDAIFTPLLKAGGQGSQA